MLLNPLNNKTKEEMDSSAPFGLDIGKVNSQMSF
jgi:hypothetical protein